MINVKNEQRINIKSLMKMTKSEIETKTLRGVIVRFVLMEQGMDNVEDNEHTGFHELYDYRPKHDCKSEVLKTLGKNATVVGGFCNKEGFLLSRHYVPNSFSPTKAFL